ncbi:E3 ubiquitin-protein ligase UHRF1 [Aplysia californica]|uniref:E3 ubiquitin-protein ligase UHRF1 n=1 Tax=Aplysia californica TaxID=6500 RepID=A0ABM0K6W4_APLCA|nr:E3 ubiquitin-protein ligase UHRF1 [Aplysia californica]
MSSYESIRLKNLEDNKRVLASFGLLDPFKSLPSIVRQRKIPSAKPESAKRKRSRPVDNTDFVGGSIYGSRRKSARIQGKDVAEYGLNDSALDEPEDDRENYTPRVPANRPNFYGAVPDVSVGTVWWTRIECCRDGVHRPTVAGIHGGEGGAYSIALSGGYEDDVDLGECFTYTGEGGRDLKGTKTNPKNLRTAPQSKDQTLTRGNLALSRNVETKNPVRVIRGYKLDSPFAPEEGYRYDGLYSVEKCWFTTGLSGHGVWKFALKRCDDQAPPSWQFVSEPNSPAKATDGGLAVQDKTSTTSHGKDSINGTTDDRLETPANKDKDDTTTEKNVAPVEDKAPLRDEEPEEVEETTLSQQPDVSTLMEAGSDLGSSQSSTVSEVAKGRTED